jgi:ribosomal protein S18 acetylase RimI-like enzyme
VPEDVRIRELGAGDGAFQRKMLCDALLWRPRAAQLIPRPLLLALPQVSMYHRQWGRDGDVGYVAEVGGRRVGAVWYRFFTDDHHGDGYVDADTPELAIAVVRRHRGRGIGRRLLGTIHDRAQRDGVRTISLSVDADNPARGLYAAVGYQELAPNDRKGRMVLELARN